MHLTVRKETLHVWAAPLAILLLFNTLRFFELKSFEAWPQITIIWAGFAGLPDYVDHFHFYRLLVASPGLWLEDLWPNQGFSMYASFFVFWSSLLFSRIQLNVSGRVPQVWSWTLLIALFFMMNGRGTIGWTGWLLVVRTCLNIVKDGPSRYTLGTMLPITTGLLLASVSSGIFVYSFIVFTYFWLFRFPKSRVKKQYSYIRIASHTLGVVLLFVSLKFALQHVLWAVERVLIFYGGGISGIGGILTHGIISRAGNIDSIHFVSALIMVVSLLIFFFSGYARHVGGDIVLLIMITLAGGIFGVTILTLAIPLMLIAFGKLFYFRFSRKVPN